MNKSVLMLINGFGVEKSGSYSIYTPSLVPNFEKLRTERMFTTIKNTYLDYRNAYRNFSMGIDDALTYNLVENNIFKNEFQTNQMIQYIIQQINKDEKCKLHVIGYWDGERTAGQLATYVKEIQTKISATNKILIHLILCQKSLEDYQYIERNLVTLGYELGPNVRIGFITGEDNLTDYNGMKEITKTFVTEYGEKYKELNKKIATQVQMKIPPSKTRTFACNY